MSDSRHSLSILYVAVLLLALNGLFSKLIPLDATSITQVRSVFAVIALMAFAILGKRQFKLDSKRQYIGIYAIGAILGLHWICFYHSMQVSTVAVGMLSLFTYPMITVLLEPFYTKQKVFISDIFAALVVLLGVFIMLGGKITAFDSDIVQGVFWGVISAFLFALRNLLQKYYYPEVSSDRLMLHQVLAVAIMLLVFVDFPSALSLSVNDWLTLLLLGVVSTATAHTLLSYSLKRLAAKSVAMISCLQPFIATLFAWLLLNEEPTNAVLIGGCIIVSVALYESLKKSKVNEK